MISALRNFSYFLFSGLIISTAAWACFVKNEIGWALLTAFFGSVFMYIWHRVMLWMFGVRRMLGKHLGVPASQAIFLDREFGKSKIADAQKTIEAFYQAGVEAEDPTVTRIGVDFDRAFHLQRLSFANLEQKQINWTTRMQLDDTFESIPINALYFLSIEGRPVCVCIPGLEHVTQEFEDEWVLGTGSGQRVEVAASCLEDAEFVIRKIIEDSSKHSILRGQLIKVSTPRDGYSKNAIRICQKSEVKLEQVLLPEELLETLLRLARGGQQFRDVLNRHGYSAKTGILLHGSPGTGKTLICKYLISQLEGLTGITLGDLDFESIRQAFRLAEYLQPSIVVIEDVDLLAERREKNFHVTALQQLMSELDGLSPGCEAMVIMTTNRPDVIEPAIASRPGRVSQALEFPLPDEAMREKLFRHYCRQNLDLKNIDLARLIQRTRGSSPAFIEELCRRTVLFAAERCQLNSQPSEEVLELTNEDFDQALHELVIFGGEVTRGIVGFHHEPDGA